MLAVCGFLVFAVLVVFFQTSNHDFINFDDDEYVRENEHVYGGLTREGIVWAFTTFHSANWHPLTWLSHMLDCQLYDLKPRGHHLTNVFLHAATAILLFLTFRRMTGALWPSAWVAAVFAIHPLRVESVAWVAERKDVLSGFFFMLTLWFYACYVERPASWGRYLLVVASYALGLMAKPMLVTLPFVLLLLDYWPLGRFGPLRSANRKDEADVPQPDRRLLRLLVEKIPLFVLAAASCVVTLAAQSGAIRSLEQVAFPERLANAAVSYVAYLGKMFYPSGLAVLYPLPKDPPPVWETVAAVALLLAISTAVFTVRRKCPYLVVGWLWYLGTLAPVIGLVQVGSQKMADRYTYLPQIGLYTALAWGAIEAARTWHWRRWCFAAVPALVVVGLIGCAWQQTRHWRNSNTLWTHTLACTSLNPIAHYDLAQFLAVHGQADRAIAEYQKALELNPGSYEAHTSLGVALAGHGQTDEAMAHYRKALEINPNYAKANNNLGVALAARREFDEAIKHYQKALANEPDYAEAHYNLGLALGRRGQFDEAIPHYRKAIEIKPGYIDARYMLGNALAGSGKIDESIDQFRKVLELKSDYAEAHYYLGLALANRGSLGEAIEQYKMALDLATVSNNSALAEKIRAQMTQTGSGD